MNGPLFTGSAVAIVTPFGADGKVNFEKLAELIDFQIENGTSAIVICGTTGESATQSLGEHAETVSFAIRHTAKRVPVIAGGGSNDTMAALYLCQHAEEQGADGLLLVTPYYNKATQKGLIKHYEYIADRISIPIILYNVPARTGCNFAASTYAHLAKHKSIHGVKEASGDFELVSRTLAATAGEEFYIWSGDDKLALPMISLGAKGLISVLANIAPRPMARICEYALAGDYVKARELHLKYFSIMDAMFYEVNPIPVKTSMNLMGMSVGNLRLPLCEMEDANLAKLKQELASAGLIQPGA
ncbi:MAG: 4-hydroxy-tetrahydrodipicolinate synthase [Oscillospiraceae bacterium]|jgi:4-hydroxy-tetrahydrodipicolinate synthase|nr:4-hydroxy-tetrahydrodipicolinate synthase [Oscillospiraceae bacterium]